MTELSSPVATSLAGRRTVDAGPVEPAALGSPSVDQFDWLITSFTRRLAGVTHAVVVSADGLTLSFSESLTQDRADQVAAVVSGLQSLARGAAKCFGAGATAQTVVEMERGLLLLMPISNHSSLAALALPDSDLGVITYEMALLVERCRSALTPELRAELRTSI